MSMFGKWFNTSSETGQNDTMPWLQLHDLSQLDQIVEASCQKPQLIFKHSTRCGISRMVKRGFEADFPFTKEEVDLYYLDLLNYRQISNEMAIRFGVYHESPQLVVIKNGKVLKYASHGAINDLDLHRIL